MSPRDPPNKSISSTTSLTDPSTGESEPSPSLQATASMCHHCFDVLLHQLNHNHIHNNSKKSSGGGYWRSALGVGNNSAVKEISAVVSSSATTTTSPKPTAGFVDALPHENVECPLFVTWERKRPSSRGLLKSSSTSASHSSSNSNSDHTFELRGCIGTLSPRPLATSIGEYALISALKDKRFDPVRLPEVPQLRVAVSLLVQYEECRHVHDWSVGVHGIVIRWHESSCCGATSEKKNDDGDDVAQHDHNKMSSRLRPPSSSSSSSSSGKDYSATYLPEVALDQGWDQKMAVSSLIRKAGFHGPISPDLLARVKCTRYQSSKHRVTFEEYMQQQQQQQQASVSSLQQQQSSSSLTSQQQQRHHNQSMSESNDKLVAEAIRELEHLPNGAPGSTDGRTASPPTCRIV